MTDDLELRRRRAAYRAAHRGTKEMDVLVGRYAEARLPTLEGAALGHFEQFLSVADPTLQAWIFATEAMGESEFSGLVNDIRVFHGLNALNDVKG
ncbi:MAG: succinate dehydrogenase assembly factor 2 [Hyphomicrobium sp.]|nr:succinate dehydrogenase assembly factor 2 [Hyphomicrobium sp.]